MPVTIKLEVKDDGTAVIQKVKGEVKSLEKDTASATQGMQASWKQMIAVYAAAAAAIAAVTAVIGKSIKAAIEQEQIFKRLETTVNLTGGSYRSSEGRIKEFLTTMQATTRYGDTEMAGVLQQITLLTGSLEKGFIGAKLAANIAAQGLFDIGSASRYVAMAMEGEVTMLGRYIQAFKQTAMEQAGVTTQAEKAAYAMRILNETFGGAAAKDVQTTEGAIAQMKNAIGDLSEAIGDIFLPLLTDIATSITPIVKGIAEWIESTNQLKQGLKELSALAEDYANNQDKWNINTNKSVVTAEDLFGVTEATADTMTAIQPIIIEVGKGFDFMSASADNLTRKLSAIEVAGKNVAKAISKTGDSVADTANTELEAFRKKIEEINEQMFISTRYAGEMKPRLGDKEEIEEYIIEPGTIPPPEIDMPTAGMDSGKQFAQAFSSALQTAVMMTALDPVFEIWGLKGKSFIKTFIRMLIAEIMKLAALKFIDYLLGFIGMGSGEIAAILASNGGIIPGKAGGGPVQYLAGGGRGTDTVPAWLTPGEYVINREATARNRPILDMINRGDTITKNNVSYQMTFTVHSFDRQYVREELIPMLKDLGRQGYSL